MIIPPTWLAAGCLALAVTGFAGGYKVRSWQCAATLAKIERAAEARRAKQQTNVETQSTQFEKEREHVANKAQQTQSAIRTIYRDRVVPADCELASSGLLNDQIADANGRITGESRPAVSADPAASNPGD